MSSVTEDFLESIRGGVPPSRLEELRTLLDAAVSGRLSPDELVAGLGARHPAPRVLPDPSRELELVHAWVSSPARLSRRVALGAAGGDG